VPHVTILLVWIHRKDDVSLKINIISIVKRWSYFTNTNWDISNLLLVVDFVPLLKWVEHDLCCMIISINKGSSQAKRQAAKGLEGEKELTNTSMPSLIVHMNQGSFLYCWFTSTQKPPIPIHCQVATQCKPHRISFHPMCLCRHYLPLLHLNEHFVMCPTNWWPIKFAIAYGHCLKCPILCEVPHTLHHCFNDEKWCCQCMIKTNSPIQLPFHSLHSKTLHY
jgi:hypothetical protein